MITKYIAYSKSRIIAGSHFGYGSVIRHCMIMLLTYWLQYVFWKSVYSGRTQIANIQFNQMLVYLYSSQLYLTIIHVRVDREIGREIKKGNFSNQLMRPVDVYIATLFSSMGKAFWRVVINGIPYLAILSILNLYSLISPMSIVKSIIMLSLSFLLSYNLDFSIGILAAWLNDTEGLMHAKDFLVSVLSGALVPLALFPLQLKTMLDYFPFRYLISEPIKNLVGLPSEYTFIRNITVCAVWVILLSILNQFIYKKCIKRLVIFGG